MCTNVYILRSFQTIDSSSVIDGQSKVEAVATVLFHIVHEKYPNRMHF